MTKPTRSAAILSDQDQIPLVDLVGPHRALEAELVAALRHALETGGFVGGPEVARFEAEFAAFVEAESCVGVSNGTDALRFAYLAQGITPNDEVVTAPNTFIATTEALTQAGGRVRFADVDPNTLTLDPGCLEAAITPRTVGVVPVHLYGQPAQMDRIIEIAARHDLWVVEDAAQAHGARYQGRAVGTFGQFGAFSFYPAKNLGALGEAGAVVGAEAALELVRRLRDHGQTEKYHHEIEGYNGRLDAIQAAFLRIKLRHLANWNEERRSVAARYREALAGLSEIRLPAEQPHTTHVYHLFVIRAERRDGLRAHLSRRGIATGLHYPVPLHLQRAYHHLGLGAGAFPVAERAAETILSLPMFPGLTEGQVARIAEAIREFYRGSV